MTVPREVHIPALGTNSSQGSERSRLPFWKRTLDLVVAVPALMLATPLLLGVALLVRVTLGRPVLFRQVRTGFEGRRFTLAKFRTMRGSPDSGAPDRGDSLRLTRVGRILRRTSLDELPTLWSVIRGDMSLVGPRPLLPEYLPLYTPRQARRHEVHPGITGWAQINGRNAINWEQKFEYDVWYVDNRSLWLDLKILALTTTKVFAGVGVAQEGRVTTDFFTGTVHPRDQS